MITHSIKTIAAIIMVAITRKQNPFILTSREREYRELKMSDPSKVHRVSRHATAANKAPVNNNAEYHRYVKDSEILGHWSKGFLRW